MEFSGKQGDQWIPFGRSAFCIYSWDIRKNTVYFKWKHINSCSILDNNPTLPRLDKITPKI